MGKKINEIPDVKLIKMNVLPEWLIHNACNADQNRKAVVLRLLAGLIDFRPRLRDQKKKLFKRIHRADIPPIGHIHIPKTGGSFLSEQIERVPFISFNHVLLRERRSDKWCPVGLTPISYKKTEGFYLFSTVRNPLTWLISYYHHVRSFGDHVNQRHYDYKLAQQGFETLIEAIITRESPWPSKKFLFPQLFGQKNEPVIDWVNRNESLTDDLEAMFAQFSVDFDVDSARVRSAPKTKLDQDYYSDELLHRVCRTYRREMEIFGYDKFSSINPSVDLKKFKSSGLTYNYQTDVIEKEACTRH